MVIIKNKRVEKNFSTRFVYLKNQEPYFTGAPGLFYASLFDINVGARLTFLNLWQV